MADGGAGPVGSIVVLGGVLIVVEVLVVVGVVVVVNEMFAMLVILEVTFIIWPLLPVTEYSEYI